MNKITYAKLRGRIAEKGYTNKFMAAKLGITVPGFVKKLNGVSDWKLKEIKIILEVLDSDFNDLFSE